jgi:hypothetical protein
MRHSRKNENRYKLFSRKTRNEETTWNSSIFSSLCNTLYFVSQSAGYEYKYLFIFIIDGLENEVQSNLRQNLKAYTPLLFLLN